MLHETHGSRTNGILVVCYLRGFVIKLISRRHCMVPASSRFRKSIANIRSGYRSTQTYVPPIQLYPVRLARQPKCSGSNEVLTSLGSKEMLKGPEHVFRDKLRPIMPLHPFSNGECPRQAIVREVPIVRNARHHLSLFVIGDEKPVQDSPIVEISRKPKRETDREALTRKISHHNPQFPRVYLNLCWWDDGLRSSSRLCCFTHSTTSSRFDSGCGGWLRCTRSGPAGHHQYHDYPEERYSFRYHCVSSK